VFFCLGVQSYEKFDAVNDAVNIGGSNRFRSDVSQR
jgi:hypothetical protein